MANKYKIVLKEFNANRDKGMTILNGGTEYQPYLDGSGNIDMSGNFLKVKNIEAGQTSFSINSQLGVINTYSDSTDTDVYCINMKHDRNNTGGYNRRYCSFLPRNTDNIAGSITGNNAQVSFNTMSDSRTKNIEASGNIINYSTTDTTSIKSTSTQYSTWLDSVNSLNPYTFSFKPSVVSTTGDTNDGYFNYTLNDTSYSILYQGFIAQDVQQTYPPAVTEPNDTNSYYQMDATKLIPMMVGSIKELSNTLTHLNTQLNTVNEDITNLKILSVLNFNWTNWTILNVGYQTAVFKTIGIDGTSTFLNTQYTLTTNYWGFSNINNVLTVAERNTLANSQLNDVISGYGYTDISGVKFIYDNTFNLDILSKEYSYLTVNFDAANNQPIIVDISGQTSISGVFGIIYQPPLSGK